MKYFFFPRPIHYFTLFSWSHLLALMVIIFVLLEIFLLRGKLGEAAWNRRFRYFLIGLLAFFEIGQWIWVHYQKWFTIAYSLPLQLCDISLFLCIVMLLTKNYKVFEVVYFTGVGGAGQALLTPDLDYDFPHFLYFEFFILHAGIVWACLFMVWVEHYRPCLRSIFKTMVYLNLYMAVIFQVDRITHGDYLYLLHKPEHSSLMNYLGPYPWYLLSLEGVALVLLFLLYWPFSYRGNKLVK